MAELLDLDAAAGLVGDGDTVYTGGAVLRRKPMALLRALVAAGRRDLDVVTFAGSLDVDLLVGAGVARSVSTGYVGLGHHGFAPRFTAAVLAGDVDDREHTEWTLLGQLRAAAMGIPFLPTRAGAGSAIVADLGLQQVVDPYGGGTYHALPPLRPDVTLLHAWRASPAGDVQFSWPPSTCGTSTSSPRAPPRGSWCRSTRSSRRRSWPRSRTSRACSGSRSPRSCTRRAGPGRRPRRPATTRTPTRSRATSRPRVTRPCWRPGSGAA